MSDHTSIQVDDLQHGLPRVRSPAYAGLTAAATTGQLWLQACRDCGTIQYPPRECCRHCLGDVLEWREQSGAGRLLAEATLHHSNAAYFRDRLPWRIGIVRLDIGVSVIAHVHRGCAAPPGCVTVRTFVDVSGNGALLALPANHDQGLPADPRFASLD